jgi:DNA helicase HerA-like ATPase
MADILPFPRKFRLPGPRDRLAVIGRTGSGKTHFAVWALSLANWPLRPWVIVDYKHDDLIKMLPGLEEIDVSPRRLPRHPGLYVVHPRPDDDEKVERLLMRIWERGHTGVYIDEGHILPEKGGLKTILTQGRSKFIPAIVLTQRPKWVSRFVFSEADAFAIFHLNDKRDKSTVQEMVPVDLGVPLPHRHSWYYRVDDDELFHMLPVPGRAEVLDTFHARQPDNTKRRMI